MKTSDVDRLCCATDAGREGELIFRLVYHQAHCKKPFDPLADAELAQNCLACADRFGAAIAALPLVDTIKAVQDGRIVATLDRSRLWQAQTPQAARRELLIQAYALAEKDGFQATDEAVLLEHAGIAVHTVAGSRRNLKITRPEDLLLARVLLNAGNQV